MRLYFVRHAQSTNNALVDETGTEEGRSHDPPLTDAGHRQAELVAAFLSSGRGTATPPGVDAKDLLGIEFTHLYCSLMDRAIVTARHISRAIGLPLVAHPEVHETGGIFLQDPETGEYVGLPGRTVPEFRAIYPELELPEGIREDGWWNRPFESLEERAARAKRVWKSLIERHGRTDDCICLVSHGEFFNWLTAEIIGCDSPSSLWLTMNNTAVTRFDVSGGYVRLRYLNRTDHLPPELIT